MRSTGGKTQVLCQQPQSAPADASLQEALGSSLTGICLCLCHPSWALVNVVLYFIPSVYDWYTSYLPCLFTIRCLIVLMHTSCQENKHRLFPPSKEHANDDCEQTVNEVGMALAFHARAVAACPVT